VTTAATGFAFVDIKLAVDDFQPDLENAPRLLVEGSGHGAIANWSFGRVLRLAPEGTPSRCRHGCSAATSRRPR
jgi:hypothetical protein